MVISQKAWNKYIATLRNINNAAADYMEMWLRVTFKGGVIDTVTRDNFGNNLIDIAYLCAETYGNASAAVAAEMYEAIAEASGVTVPPALLAPNPTYNECAKTVQGVLLTPQNREELSSAVGRLVKQTGARTTRLNARRDGAQYAWVPSGDTCAWCIMLAGHGWQYARKESYKDHIHSNCDCTYAVRFNNKTDIAGYDPEAYAQQYRDAEGGTRDEKLNAMRRKYYAQNREEILAQKTSAAEKREELNSSKAEEDDISG